jgi:hypothetical protein
MPLKITDILLIITSALCLLNINHHAQYDAAMRRNATVIRQDNYNQ